MGFNSGFKGLTEYFYVLYKSQAKKKTHTEKDTEDEEETHQKRSRVSRPLTNFIENRKFDSH